MPDMHISEPVTLFSLIHSKIEKNVCYQSGLRKLDSSLLGGNGFTPTQLYDISSTPGTVGKWELIFHVVLNILSKDSRKILIIENFEKIPWFKMERNNLFQSNWRSRIECINAKTLSEIAYLLQQFHFNDYSLVIVDGFQDMCHAAEVGIKKNTKDGVYAPLRKLQDSINLLVTTMSKFADQGNTIFITTGKLNVFNQRIKQSALEQPENDDSDYSDTEDPSFFIQRILVPEISLQSVTSDLYANRIVLYNDWVNKDSKRSGLDQSVGITRYIRMVEKKQMSVTPHFLCISTNANSSANKDAFVQGSFQVSDNFELIDGEQGCLEQEATVNVITRPTQSLEQVEASDLSNSPSIIEDSQ